MKEKLEIIPYDEGENLYFEDVKDANKYCELQLKGATVGLTKKEQDEYLSVLERSKRFL